MTQATRTRVPRGMTQILVPGTDRLRVCWVRRVGVPGSQAGRPGTRAPGHPETQMPQATRTRVPRGITQILVPGTDRLRVCWVRRVGVPGSQAGRPGTRAPGHPETQMPQIRGDTADGRAWDRSPRSRRAGRARRNAAALPMPRNLFRGSSGYPPRRVGAKRGIYSARPVPWGIPPWPRYWHAGHAGHPETQMTQIRGDYADTRALDRSPPCELAGRVGVLGAQACGEPCGRARASSHPICVISCICGICVSATHCSRQALEDWRSSRTIPGTRHTGGRPYRAR